MLHLQEDIVSPSRRGNYVLYLLNNFSDYGLGFRRLLRVFVGVRFVTMEFVATIQLLFDDEGVCAHEQTNTISLKKTLNDIPYPCTGHPGI